MYTWVHDRQARNDLRSSLRFEEPRYLYRKDFSLAASHVEEEDTNHTAQVNID